MSLSKQVKGAIRCPKCKGELNKVEGRLECDLCQVSYLIWDDIPVLIDLERARELSEFDQEHARIEKLEADKMIVSSEDWVTDMFRAPRRMERVLHYIPKDGLYLDIGCRGGNGSYACTGDQDDYCGRLWVKIDFTSERQKAGCDSIGCGGTSVP